MIPGSSYLFVYGTLMRRFEHAMHELLVRHSEYFCNGCFQGKLYQISWYPAVIPSEDPADEVYGEIYRILNGPLLFETLDTYELCSLDNPASGEYIRRTESIRTSDDRYLDCHIYLYNRSLHEARFIPDGKFTSMKTD